MNHCLAPSKSSSVLNRLDDNSFRNIVNARRMSGYGFYIVVESIVTDRVKFLNNDGEISLTLDASLSTRMRCTVVGGANVINEFLPRSFNHRS